jgi:hypothetical protein
MTRYFVVKCATCDSTIPVAFSRQVRDTNTMPNVAPIERLFSRVCGTSRGYSALMESTSMARTDYCRVTRGELNRDVSPMR